MSTCMTVPVFKSTMINGADSDVECTRSLLPPGWILRARTDAPSSPLRSNFLLNLKNRSVSEPPSLLLLRSPPPKISQMRIRPCLW